MKNLTFFEKWFVGAFSIRTGVKYLNFPKIAPMMTLSMVLMGFYQPNGFNNPILFYTGLVLFLIGVFSFFYFEIFPKKRPIDLKDAEKFIMVINEKA